MDGAFCRACAFFALESVGGHVLGQLVTKPLKVWNKMSEKASAHNKYDYHLASLARMSEFRACYENPTKSIDTILNRECQLQMERNAKVIASLLQVVLLCGKQGIALRGHRDDHISWHEALTNHGNFIELVRFRAVTDSILAEHLQNSPANAKYTSKTIQNELVEVIGKCILSEILEEVRQSKYYSLIADEVTDSANKIVQIKNSSQ